ncbi:MAG: hypothetical protein MI749_11565, partial [Desulfovibrionales bacterium]|nr:hypothetical protein [Desulfovibrionales bacterium]
GQLRSDKEAGFLTQLDRKLELRCLMEERTVYRTGPATMREWLSEVAGSNVDSAARMEFVHPVLNRDQSVTTECDPLIMMQYSFEQQSGYRPRVESQRTWVK